MSEEELPSLGDFRGYTWRKGDLRWLLDPLQLKMRDQIAKADAKKICILSSRQIGKSYFSCAHSLEFLARNKNKIARIIAPTKVQCGDIVNDNLSPIILDAPPAFISKRSYDNRWHLANGSSLRLGALERAHVDGNRGGNASLIIYEECGFVSADDFNYAIDSVLGPQLLRSNGVEIFVSSPSDDPDHPLHTTILPECVELGTAFRFTVFDSPSIGPEKIIEAMRRSKCTAAGEFEHWVTAGLVTSKNVHELAARSNTKLSEAFRREYLAEIIRPSTLMVVPDYDERLHVAHFQAPLKANWHVTIDWGGVRDKTVGLLHTYDFLRNKDVILDERVFAANTATREIVEAMRSMEGGREISSRWADVPGQLQIDLADVHNYIVNIPQKSDWLASVQAMAAKFSLDQIEIHPGCKFLRKSCRAGQFNKPRTDFSRANEDIGHCDALAALGYAIRMADRTNPYPPNMPSEGFYIMPQAHSDGVKDLGEALNPNRFGRFK